MSKLGGPGIENRLALLWRGRGRFRSGMAQVMWGSVRLIFSNWLWGTAVRLAHFQLPTKRVGLFVALLSIFMTIWALWGFGKALFLMGFKKLIITILAGFLILVSINVLTIPDPRPIGARIVVQLGTSVQQVGNALFNWTNSAKRAPDDFLFAYSGQRALRPLPPGFPTPNPNATPVQISAIGSESLPIRIPTPVLERSVVTDAVPSQPAANDNAAFTLEIGSYAQVVNTGGQPLRARSQPGTDSEIVARFAPSTRLLSLDGPIVSGGLSWWQRRNENGEEGWCADQWLKPMGN